MNIGIITECLNKKLTGIGVYTNILIEHLLEMDNKNNYFFINFKENPFEYGNFSCKAEYIFIKNYLGKFTSSYIWNLYVCYFLKKYDIDIVHNPSQALTFFKFKSMNLITIHDLTPLLYPSTHIFFRKILNELLLPNTLKNASKIISVSNSTKKDLIKVLNIPEEKINVVHSGINKIFKKINKNSTENTLNKYSINFPYILYVGTLEPRKNISSLIMSFYKLKKKNLANKLVIVGSKGWKYSDIFTLAKKLKLSNDIIFTDYIPEDNLPAFYNGADLFVYPSLYEGFGFPPLEAMACGCPVITSNTSSLPEIVDDAAIMINPYNIDELTNQMQNVLKDENLKNLMIKKGLQRSKKFSWEKCAKETLTIYKSLE